MAHGSHAVPSGGLRPALRVDHEAVEFVGGEGARAGVALSAEGLDQLAGAGWVDGGEDRVPVLPSLEIGGAAASPKGAGVPLATAPAVPVRAGLQPTLAYAIS